MAPKVGDTVYFDECPDYMWDSKNPCGTVTAIYAETGYVQVKTTNGHKMRFEEDSSWSVCGSTSVNRGVSTPNTVYNQKTQTWSSTITGMTISSRIPTPC